MRAVKAAVVVMGVLIVAGVALLVVLLVGRMQAPATGANVLLDEPAGTRIAGSSASGDRMTVQLQGGGPDRVVIVDLRAGRVAGRVALAR